MATHLVTSASSDSRRAVASQRWAPHGGRLLGAVLAAPAIAVVGLFVIAPLVQVFVDASSGGAGLDRHRDVPTRDRVGWDGRWK